MSVNDRMKPTYTHWPFKPDLDDGRTNIGAIDLTKNPERIDEIRELDNMPTLKEKISLLNSESNGVMTLGMLCDTSKDEGIWYAYLEFGFRPNYDFSAIDLNEIDSLFYDHLSLKGLDDYAKVVRPFVVWEGHPLTLHGNIPSHHYSVFLKAVSQQDVEGFYCLLVDWLRAEFAVS